LNTSYNGIFGIALKSAISFVTNFLSITNLIVFP
jgi:hypothetical protein